MPQIRVFQYGLGAPIEGGEVVQEQMRLAHRYRNDLIAIERARRFALRALNPRLPEDDTHDAAVASYKEVCEAIKKYHSDHRTKKHPKELADQKAQAKEALVASSKALKEARALARSEASAEQERLKIYALDALIRKGARALCNVYWGTYLLVEKAMEASVKQPLYFKGQPNDPYFVPWREASRRVGVQIQDVTAQTQERIFGGTGTLLRIAPVDPRAYDTESTPRCERKKLSRTTLMMRVGSTDKGKPVWATWPMFLHRPLPKGATVQTAAVTLKSFGSRDEWTCELTVTVPDEVSLRRHRGQDGTVFMDLGWRKIGDDLRVAFYGDDTSDVGVDFRLGSPLVSSLRKADELRAMRAEDFNRAKSGLLLRLKTVDDEVVVPDWLANVGKYLHALRSADKLHHIAKEWGTKRFVGDTEMYEALEKWRKRDRWVRDWEVGQREKALLWRRETFRILASKLAAQYKTLVIEGRGAESSKPMDLRAFAERADKSESVVENEVARSNRVLAALSELRGCLENAFGKDNVVTIDPQGTTHICHACGSNEDFDAALSILHRCQACGVEWDQDDNAWKNMRERFRALPAPETPLTPATTPKRWAKRHKPKSSVNAPNAPLGPPLANTS